MFEYEGSDEPLSDPKQNFKVQLFFSVLDTTISSVKERFLQLKQHNEDFKVLLNISQLKEWNDDDLLKHCKDLQLKLTNDKNNEDRDIDGNTLFEELKAFYIFMKTDMTPHDILNYIYHNKLTDTFPNIFVRLRIYLTLPVSVASGERRFSKLNLIKNYMRSTMSQEHLVDLPTYNID
ncbi:hAT family C-terminal dimerization region [Popillia japonica]|uniref:HAT family C-terminal dimerization region n=1 Tax=Popillia japonica TaxID=7064 RepID=A0AAW1N2Y4_POPJA